MTSHGSRTTLHNFAFSAARLIVSAGGGVAVSVLMARSLGAAAMGRYSFTLWVAGLVTGLSALGLPDTIARYVAEHRGLGQSEVAAQIARRILRLQWLAALGIALLVLAVWYALEPSQAVVIALAIASVAPAAAQQTMSALMEGEQRFDLQMAVSFGGAVLQVVLVAACALWHPTVAAFLAVNLISTLLSAAIMWSACRPMLSAGAGAQAELPPELTRRMLSFSLSVYGLWFLNLVLWDKSEVFFLRIFRTPEEIAYYSIAYALAARLATAGDSMGYVLFPQFVTRYAQQGDEGLAQLGGRWLRLVLVGTVPLSVWGAILAGRFVRLFYGADYVPMIRVAQLLLLALVASGVTTIGSNMLYAAERQKLFLRAMAAVTVLNLLLDVWLIPRLGAVGAAAANDAAVACACAAVLWQLHRWCAGCVPVKAMLKVALAGTFSAVPLAACERMQAGWLAVGVALALAAAIYLSGLMLFGAASWSELRNALGRQERVAAPYGDQA